MCGSTCLAHAHAMLLHAHAMLLHAHDYIQGFSKTSENSDTLICFFFWKLQHNDISIYTFALGKPLIYFLVSGFSVCVCELVYNNNCVCIYVQRVLWYPGYIMSKCPCKGVVKRSSQFCPILGALTPRIINCIRALAWRLLHWLLEMYVVHVCTHTSMYRRLSLNLCCYFMCVLFIRIILRLRQTSMCPSRSKEAILVSMCVCV